MRVLEFLGTRGTDVLGNASLYVTRKKQATTLSPHKYLQSQVSDDEEKYPAMPRGEMSRPSARGSGDRKVNYYEDDDDSVDDEKEEEDAFIIDDDDDAVVVLDDSEDDIDRRMSNKKVLSSASKTKGVVAACQSISLPPGRMTVQDHDAKKYGQKMAAVPAASRSRGNVNSPRKRKTQSIDSANDQGSNDDEGMDIVIPHSLLDKSRGSGKNECMVLVQVADEPASYGTTSTKTSQQQQKQQHRPLDFHGQSGAIGRFEADGDGGTLCHCFMKLFQNCVSPKMRFSHGILLHTFFLCSHLRPQGISIPGHHPPGTHGNGGCIDT